MPRPSSLHLGEVDGAYVRLYDLDADWQADDAADELLSEDERERAARFHTAREGRRFVRRCAFLRRALGSLGGVAPTLLEFGRGAQGKPYIVCRDEISSARLATLQFNLAHTENVMALAVAFGRPVGVDIEAVRPGVDVLRIAAERLTTEEYELLRELPAKLAVRAFYRLWTRHQAVAKTTGEHVALRHPAMASADPSLTLHSFAVCVGELEVVGALGLGSFGSATTPYRRS